MRRTEGLSWPDLGSFDGENAAAVDAHATSSSRATPLLLKRIVTAARLIKRL
jgi:hypothetical protein